MNMNRSENVQAAPDMPLVPARMVNEYVYCPRLAYLMWVQGEFAHNEYTVDGAIKRFPRRFRLGLIEACIQGYNC